MHVCIYLYIDIFLVFMKLHLMYNCLFVYFKIKFYMCIVDFQIHRIIPQIFIS